MASKGQSAAAAAAAAAAEAERRRNFLKENERLLGALSVGRQVEATTTRVVQKDQSSRGGRTRRRFKKHRLMSRKYCKKTPCRRMGFTQKASCRPYKNCYTRKK